MSHDDVEVNNPIGTARGKHQLGSFFATFTNLASRDRFNHRRARSEPGPSPAPSLVRAPLLARSEPHS